MSKPTEAISVISYKDALLVTHAKGFDVMDIDTGRWYTTHSLRSAKWNAAVWSRLRKALLPVEQGA